MSLSFIAQCKIRLTANTPLLVGQCRILIDMLETSLEELKKSQAEARIKGEWISSRQCPDHSGKWERGRCLMCEIEQLQHRE